MEHYQPPAEKAATLKARVVSDLTNLAQAMEAYYAKNLKHPERLEELKPDFIESVPTEPTGKPFSYQLDGKNGYRIGVSDSVSYGFEEVYVRNGKVYQK